MKRLVFVVQMAVAGCALDAGTGFGALAPGTIAARLELGARDLGGGEILTMGGARVRLDRLALEVTGVELFAASEGSRFDPAAPPPGYSLCHSGHCHADDGRLVSYADIQAELGGAAPASTLRFPVAATIVVPGEAPLARFEPSAALEPGTLSRAEVRLGGVEIDARAGQTAIRVRLPLEDIALAAVVDLDVDRNTAPLLAPRIELTLDGALFDGLAITTTASIAIDAATDPGAAELAEQLARGRAAVRFEERDTL